jgi:hypothetical protein
MDQETSSLYQKTVYDLTQQSGYRFQVRNALSPADLEAGLKVVIAFPPDPGLVSLAAAASQRVDHADSTSSMPSNRSAGWPPSALAT